jgi:general nucleoside transport system ATP-binding protein
VTPGVALTLDNIFKRFGSTDALLGASLTVRAGSVHALLGENGAGKTTLMHVAFGLVQPDRGAIRIEGREVRHLRTRDAIRAGIGMVHQHFTVVPAMTVAENVALGGIGRLRLQAVAARIREIGAETGLVLDPGAQAGSLGVAAQQQLEIVKALAHDARILILDEPTAVLAPAEASQLLRRLRQLATDGLTVVLITHKLPEALAIADDVTVLRHGRTVLSAPASTVSEHELADAMLGSAWRESRSAAPTDLDTAMSILGENVPMAARNVVPELDTQPTRSRRSRQDISRSGAGPVVAHAVNVTVVDSDDIPRLRNATLAIHAGEIVGVAGVAGSGVHELLRAFAGRAVITAGVLNRPDEVGFVPEDRHRDALVLSFSLAENVALRGASARRGLMRWPAIEARTRALITDFDVRATGPRDTAATLSGGNQQKLVLARELGDAPALLVIENPTRGLDLRASADVHDRLRHARESGTAILLHSSDLDEVLALADRVVVTHAGVLAEVERDHDRIGQAMLGAGLAV